MFAKPSPQRSINRRQAVSKHCDDDDDAEELPP
jgi:hypothetical protein